MPIMAIYRNSDVDPETFNRFRAEVPIEPLPAGAILHLVAFAEDGLLGIDVWDDEDHLRAFNETKIKPALSRMGKTWIEPTVVEIHELWAANVAPERNFLAPAPQLDSTSG